MKPLPDPSERVYEPPTFEQLVGFVAVQLHGAQGMFPATKETVRRILDGSPKMRETWLQRHRETQESIWRLADEERREAAR